MGGFYAAFALSGLCDDSDPLLSHGAIKGMLLRHLRWWATHSEHVFATDGTLNIGFLFPNMYMSEAYNSPQSPYWAAKSLIALALGDNTPFWTAEETPHTAVDVLAVKPARQIVCSHGKGLHHFLLSSGQFGASAMVKATQAKYSKFAYSSAFGFSVPCGPALTQVAADSVLTLSCDAGESWAVRWMSLGETQFVTVPVGAGKAEALRSVWKPWKAKDVQIETTLVAPCDGWPDWHVRVHRIRSERLELQAVEGGFAIDGRRKVDGRRIPTTHDGVEAEVALEGPDCALVVSSAGASGIVDLAGSGKGEVMKLDPNTNLITQRTLLPTVHYEFRGEVVLASAVFGVSYKGGELTKDEVQARWEQRPKITLKDGQWSLE